MKKISNKKSASLVACLLSAVLFAACCAATELLEFSDEMLEFILQTDTEVLQAIEHRPLLDTVSEAILQQAETAAVDLAAPDAALGTAVKAEPGARVRPAPATDLMQ
ncbi:MAG: hypothetical protein KJO24_06245 [Gammaproteobacteria bacterium]|nr:hypothetical protein [Gammaproteobacteria bacterium]